MSTPSILPSPRLRPGPLPLGYVMRGGSPHPDPKVAPLVAACFAALDKPGSSLRLVLAEATEKGLRSKRGQSLSFSSFHELATNPFYAGYVRFGTRIESGGHVPVVDGPTFWRVQGRLSERATRRAPGGREPAGNL